MERRSNPRLSSFLAARTRGDGALSRLLRNPDGEDGLAHTPREVAQQPFLWRETARMMKGRARELRSFLDRAGLFGSDCPPQVVFTGAGTSDPDSFFSKRRRFLLFHVARSGNSPESTAVLRMALRDFGQMFGLFASQRRSLNVDDPSAESGLYSRTVQGVHIYE